MAFLTEARVQRKATESAQKRLIVAVRIRPHPTKAKQGGRILHSVDDKVVVLEDVEVAAADVLRQNRGSDKQFVFDAVFDENCSQEKVYNVTTSRFINDVIEGYNATVFAYGATGSGKTHTMLGTASDPGIMVRALNDLFLKVQKESTSQNLSVTMSYLEIYNENIRDLLNPNSGYLELREDNREKSVQVVKLSEVSTNSTEEVMRLLQRGNKSRTMEATAANKTSSRSHALLTVTVRQTTQTGGGQRMRARVRQGKLFVIDLAGSERASQTNNRGKRLVEGGHINRSLLALGNCINALSGGARYVNYRDSKLTRLLKDALSGNSHTCMIAHVNPAAAHREESKNTLLYADRAKSITNKVGQNVLDISYHVSQYRTIISELRDEISRLKTKMTEPREDGDAAFNINQHPQDAHGNPTLGQLLNRKAGNNESLRDLKNHMVLTFKEQMRLRKKLLNIDNNLLVLQFEASRQHSLISEWEGRKNRLYPGERAIDSAPETGSNKNNDSTVDTAWEEIVRLEAEQEKLVEMRTTTERELEDCKERATQLEKQLPTVSSEEEREVLHLMVRVHELEVEKMELQSERILKQYELRQRDMTILRYDRQRQICEEIITRQRQIMEEGRIALPTDLQALYQMYQQELHTSSYSESGEVYHMQQGRDPSGQRKHPDLDRESDSAGTQVLYRQSAQSAPKLPPISNAFRRPARVTGIDSGLPTSDWVRTPTSASSDWLSSPLPPVSPYPSSPGLPPPQVLFPPLSRSLQEIRYDELK